jgi:glycerate dehydrogenase
MKVLIYDMINTGDIRQVDLSVLLKQSDVISLHCPLTPETRNIINADAIKLMKKSAFIINTSRGQLIDNQALADALRRGDIAGAGIDVLEQEPPPLNHPLPAATNCFVTPHISWASLEARQRLMNIAVDNLRAFLAGKPVNVVNQP